MKLVMFLHAEIWRVPGSMNFLSPRIIYLEILKRMEIQQLEISNNRNPLSVNYSELFGNITFLCIIFPCAALDAKEPINTLTLCRVSVDNALLNKQGLRSRYKLLERCSSMEN
jgi:hypothetical protein